MKPKLLLHVCCGPCSTYVIEDLSEDYEVVCYFYNPSIYPDSEYEKRLGEAKKYCSDKGVRFISGDYNYLSWKKGVKGLENEPECGKRCQKCIKDRMIATAKKAKELEIEFFSSTLSISPHKDFKFIKKCCNNIAKEFGLCFVDKDFSSGFLDSVKISKKYGLYRQNYCGCEFSFNGKK